MNTFAYKIVNWYQKLSRNLVRRHKNDMVL